MSDAKLARSLVAPTRTDQRHADSNLAISGRLLALGTDSAASDRVQLSQTERTHPPATFGDYMQLIANSGLLTESLLLRLQRVLADQQHLSPRELTLLLIRQRVLTQWQGRQLLLGNGTFYVDEYKILERRLFDSNLVTFIAEETRTQRLVTCQFEPRLRQLKEKGLRNLEPLLTWWANQRHTHLIPLRKSPIDQPSISTGPLVLDYEEGPTLSQVVRTRGPLPWRQAARLVAQFTELLQQLRPGWMSRPIELGEFQLGLTGQLRWNPLQSMLSSQLEGNDEPCRWGQQAGLLFLMLVSDVSGDEWLLRFQRRRAITLMSYPEWKQLPTEAHQMIERLITMKAAGLARASSWFREQSVAVSPAMELVPARLHRSLLHHLLRRTPIAGARALPSGRWDVLATPVAASVSQLGLDETDSRDVRDEVSEASVPEPGNNGPRSALRTGTLQSRERRSVSLGWSEFGAGRWWLYFALWAAVLLLALIVFQQQAPSRTRMLTTMSTSRFSEKMIESRKLLLWSKFDNVDGFPIGQTSILGIK